MVAYDSRRARTHLLSSVAAEVLDHLTALGSGSTVAELEADLFARVVDDTPGGLSQDERISLQAIVGELTQLGLLESRPT